MSIILLVIILSLMTAGSGSSLPGGTPGGGRHK